MSVSSEWIKRRLADVTHRRRTTRDRERRTTRARDETSSTFVSIDSHRARAGSRPSLDESRVGANAAARAVDQRHRVVSRDMSARAGDDGVGASAHHRHASAYDHAIAGQIAGMVGLALVHPLDTVKSRLQATVVTPATAGTLGAMRGGAAAMTVSTSAVGVARSLVERDGAKGLYRGLTAPMLAYGAINAVAFSTNAYARDSIERAFGEEVASSTAAGALSGAAAGLFSSFVRGPAERLKTVQQVVDCERGRYSSAVSTATTLVREHGVARGLFQGTGATIVREIPQCAVYFLTYDHIKSACVRAFCGEGVDSRDAPPVKRAASIVLAGGSAGAVQWLLTYPLDVTKSRIQAAPPGMYSGVIDCAVKSVSREGPLVLFRGLNMALLRAFPLHATIFASCEAVHSTLARMRGRTDEGDLDFS